MQGKLPPNVYCCNETTKQCEKIASCFITEVSLSLATRERERESPYSREVRERAVSGGGALSVIGHRVVRRPIKTKTFVKKSQFLC